MQKGFWIVLVVAIGGMIGIFIATGGSSTESAYSDYDPNQIQLTDHIDGLDIVPTTQEELDTILASKKAVLIEYADFQCSACRAFFPVLTTLKDQFAEDLVVVFRHFPLTSIHFDSMAAHRAAEAATNQDFFWTMHDILYLRQEQWADSNNATTIIETYAKEIGLDLEQYRTDVRSQEVFDRINVDVGSARPWGVNSTPTLFFNGEEVSPPTLEVLTGLIDAALAEDAS